MHNLYVLVSGGTSAVDVSPNEMEVEVERGDNRFSEGFSAGETVRPTEKSVP